MKLHLLKHARSIRPASEIDEDRLRRVPVGDLLPVHIRKPRNGGLHRKFFALVKLIADNHARLRTVEDVVLELKVRTHHYAEHITLDGKVVLVPRSISYEEMEELDFRTFFDRCCEVAADEMLPGIPRAQLDAYIEKVAEF